ncbi:MAG: hypothetical protein RLZZ263_409 [Cyanobacteriota bacterium]
MTNPAFSRAPCAAPAPLGTPSQSSIRTHTHHSTATGTIARASTARLCSCSGFIAVTLSATRPDSHQSGFQPPCTKLAQTSADDQYSCRRKASLQLLKRPLPGPMGHLGDKADLTPSPLQGSGSHRGGLTGETNDVVRCYGFALTEQASVTLLIPRRNHCSPLTSNRPRASRSGGEWS